MPNMELIDRFSDEYFVLNSISERRRAYVRKALVRLGNWLDKPLEQTTDEDLRSWLVSLLNGGAQPSTVNWYLRMVLPFFRWCWQHHLIPADQWERLREVNPPRGFVHEPRPYSRKEIAQLWSELEARWPLTTENSLKRWRGGARFRKAKKHAMRLQLTAIVELALVCGLRQSEIYKLSIDDVHPDNRYIVVHGKRHDQNDKVREVPYPESTRNAIKAWFRMRGFIGPEPGANLWLSITGPNPAASLTPSRMQMILHSFGDWTLHRLRHTCATERLRAGMEVERLQRLLGHANITDTLRYVRFKREDVHIAAERTDEAFQQAIGRAA